MDKDVQRQVKEQYTYYYWYECVIWLGDQWSQLETRSSEWYTACMQNMKLIKTAISLKIEIKEKYIFLWFYLLLYVNCKNIYIILKRN